jgi:hypothetical protein
MSEISNPDDWAKRGEQLLELRAKVLELGATNQTLRQKVSNLRTRVQGLEEFIEHHNYNVSDAYDWVKENLNLAQESETTAVCDYCGGYLVAHEGAITQGMHTDCYNDLKSEQQNG